MRIIIYVVCVLVIAAGMVWAQDEPELPAPIIPDGVVSITQPTEPSAPPLAVSIPTSTPTPTVTPPFYRPAKPDISAILRRFMGCPTVVCWQS